MAADPALQFPPTGACDCHVHVIGPKTRFPLSPERNYTPMDAPADLLRAMLTRLGLDRVVIVQPSIYGTDNACTLDAMRQIGDARGVAVLPAGVPGSTLDDLHRRGVRGLRVNIASGNAPQLDSIRERLTAAAQLSARNGWHVQVFMPSAALHALTPVMRELPAVVVIDHFGMPPLGADGDGAVRSLLQLLESGRCWIKLSGTYRVATDPSDPRIAVLARRLAQANPERIVWGSDWPHTPAHGMTHDNTEQPYRDIDTRALLGVVRAWFDDARLQNQVLVSNPARLYDFPDHG
jgi:predicted TIM-barrel fold metal-dependent hydrolase